MRKTIICLFILLTMLPVASFGEDLCNGPCVQVAANFRYNFNYAEGGTAYTPSGDYLLLPGTTDKLLLPNGTDKLQLP